MSASVEKFVISLLKNAGNTFFYSLARWWSARITYGDQGEKSANLRLAGRESTAREESTCQSGSC